MVGVIVLIVFAGLVLLVVCGVVKFFRWSTKKAYRNSFRGHLLEDYIQNNPELVQNGRVLCHCGNNRIILRNLEMFGPNVVREHVCNQCGARLYLSVSGKYFEDIVKELRKEVGLVAGMPGLAQGNIARTDGR